MNYRFVVNSKDGKSFQREFEKKAVPQIIGMKIGQEFDGGIIGLPGYSLKLTGGVNKDGFPMRKDVSGSIRKRLFLSKRPGYTPTGKGIRRRKMICGNTYNEDVAQINLIVVKAGTKKLSDLFGKAEKTEEGTGAAEETKRI